MNSKKALITGITGQDGSYLTELLLDFTFIRNRVIELKTLQGDDKIIIWDNKIFIIT